LRNILVPAGLHVGPKNTVDFEQHSGAWFIEEIADDGPDERRPTATSSTWARDRARRNSG
jgi:hypothetical protein